MTATSPFQNIFKRLAHKELILPHLEHALLADRWPKSYDITVDSGEYYGKGDGYFHPSTHSLMGARELYYRFHPDTKGQILTEKRTAQNHLAMAVGTALHSIVQTQMIMCGLVKPENVEWEYTNKEHHSRGRVDFIVNHPNGQTIPVELKTCASYIFQKTEVIKPAWDAQLSMGLDNFGADFGILLMMEVGFPYRWKEFRVPRNDTLLSEIYQKFDYVRECIELSTPPKYCCPFDSVVMHSCAARNVCYLAEDHA